VTIDEQTDWKVGKIKKWRLWEVKWRFLLFFFSLFSGDYRPTRNISRENKELTTGMRNQ